MGESPLCHGDPTVVSRFPVLRRLGVGGMSVVYRAYDPELDRQIAVKLVRPEGGLEASDRLRMQREARAMARINHPSVVSVYDVGEFDGALYIAMELVEGQTIARWLRETARPWSEVLRTYLQAARGLAAAHEVGLIHRDFKPDNVLVGDDGRPRVVDFGLAQPATLGPVDEEDVLLLPADPEKSIHDGRIAVNLDARITQTGLISGTPAYMSPAQHLGEPASAKCDQFSFCVALWEAIYGERPFPGKTSFALADAVLEGRRRPIPEQSRVPRWIGALLCRGLSVDPHDRFNSMRDLMAAFVFTYRVVHN